MTTEVTKAEALVDYLTAVTEMRRLATTVDLAYYGDEDVVLTHGRLFEVRDVPPRKFAHTTKKACYANALLGALEHPDLTYVEGFATSIIAVPHAWLVDADGAVHDPTWGNDRDSAYIGIPFDMDWLTDYVVAKKTYGVFGWPDGWKCTDPLPAEAIADVPSLAIPLREETK